METEKLLYRATRENGTRTLKLQIRFVTHQILNASTDIGDKISNKQVNHLASGFLRIGLNKGDRIGIWSPNSAHWYITLLAAAKAGLVSVKIIVKIQLSMYRFAFVYHVQVALNPAYQASEIAQCIKKVNMRAMVVADTFKNQNYYEMICKAIPEVTSSSDGVIRSNEFASFSTLILNSSNKLK